jgi:PAS domain S-box-containing protein
VSNDAPPIQLDGFAGSDRIFQRCVEASNEAMMITDLEGRLAYVNPAWSRIYGFSRDEALGKTPRILHSGAHDAGFYAEMWRQILDPRVGKWRGEVVNRTSAGVEVPVLLTIAPLREGDRAIGYMGIAVDIRELKEVQAQLLQQDRLASIGLLASGLAHEVGTPLAVVRGRAELLAAAQPSSSPGATAAQTIITQVDRISKLIKSLLRFSGAGRAAPGALPPMSLRSVLAEVEDLAAPALRKAGVSLRLDVDSEMLVLGEDQRLQQIFLNLVINAIHAIEEASSQDRTHARQIVVAARAAQTADVVEVGVEDTGSGISPENLPRIFQPFFTTKDVGRGTGLGLPIVAKLVDELGGDIRVRSAPGKGSTFTVRLRRPG